MISLNDIFINEEVNQFMYKESNNLESMESMLSPTKQTFTSNEIRSKQSVNSILENSAVSMDSSSFKLNSTLGGISSSTEQNKTEICIDQESINMIPYDCQFKLGINFEDIRKQNHSEVEKRRRDKMNSHIKELADLVPMCKAMPSSRKMDKSTVLRMAVQHIKALKSSMMCDTTNPMPSYIPDSIISKLFQQISEGFLMVISCDRGKILHISDSVKHTLIYTQRDLLGRSLFDILHPKDVPKVKEQITIFDDITQQDNYLDTKSLNHMKTNGSHQIRIQANPGSRRTFFCRMKYKSEFGCNKKESRNSVSVGGSGGSGGNGSSSCSSMSSGRTRSTRASVPYSRRRVRNKYCDLYCIGYLKLWSTDNYMEESDCVDGHSGCLVAIVKDMSHYIKENIDKSSDNSNVTTKPEEYVSRHGMDGIYLFVDQRVTLLLGYLPQEMVGTSCYDYCHRDDIKALAECHRKALQQNDRQKSNPFRFKTKIGTYMYFQTNWSSFKNPWTQEFEYLVATNKSIPTPDFDPIKNRSHKEMKSMSSYSSGLSCDTFLLPTSSSSSDSSQSKYPTSLQSNQSSNHSSTVTKYMKTRIKHTKIGKQIAEELLETQRRNEEFSSQSSYSSTGSGSPPSSYITQSSNVSSSGSYSINNQLNYEIKSQFSSKANTCSQLTDSGIDIEITSNHSVAVNSVNSVNSVKSSNSFSSLSAISPFNPSIVYDNYGYVFGNDQCVNNTLKVTNTNAMVSDNTMVSETNNAINSDRVNSTEINNNNDISNTNTTITDTITDTNTNTNNISGQLQSNEMNEPKKQSSSEDNQEADTFSIIMSILESDICSGASIQFGSDWPVY